MKRVRLAILFLLILLCSVAFAALTKTTSIITLDGWQSRGAGALSVGNAGDISGSYTTIMYLEIAYADNNAQDGVGVKVEVSYGDDDWTLFADFTTPTNLNGGYGDDLDGAVTAGDTTITLTLGGAPAYTTRGQKIFILNGAASESVRIKSVAGATITLCHVLLNSYNDATPVFAVVHDFVFEIPAAFAYVRVLINNTDVNAGIYWTTRLSKVTGL